MCKAHQHEEYGWLDVLEHIDYAEGHYNGEVTLTLSTNSPASKDAVLCIDATVRCVCLQRGRLHIITTREVSGTRLRHLQEEAREALYEAEEAWIEAFSYCGCTCFGRAKVIV